MQKAAKYKLSDEQIQQIDTDIHQQLSETLKEMFGKDILAPEQGWDFASFAEKMAEYQAYFIEEERDDEFMHQSESTKLHLHMANDVERWLNQMYRRTAKVLHPDLQIDEQLKLEYQEKMAQLSHAKDIGDITTIFDLYLQYIGD